VPNRGANIVSVIDASSDKVLKSIKVGREPLGITVDPAENRAYVTNHKDISVSIIDTENNTVVGTVKLSLTPNSPYAGSPWGVAVD